MKLPTVLVVDDDPDHALMLQWSLEALRWRVKVAHSCREARALLRGSPMEAIVCDLKLGDGDALQLARSMRQHWPLAAVVLSGFDAPEVVERSRRAGYDAHLVKPCDVEELDVILRAKLQRSPKESARLAKAQPAFSRRTRSSG